MSRQSQPPGEASKNDDILDDAARLEAALVNKCSKAPLASAPLSFLTLRILKASRLEKMT